MTALSGVSVVDASGGVAGGYCTKLLAGLGAGVIKVERPGVGDTLRRAGPFLLDVPNVETSAMHLHLNAGKRSITLDIASPTAAALLHRLLEGADVFVVGDTAGQRTTLSASALGERLPQLVVASITPFGTTGPDAHWRAMDIVSHAAGGYLAMTGDPDRAPVKPYGHQAEYQAGLHAALGVVAALTSRERCGSGGQHVDVSTAEASSFLVGGALARAFTFGRESKRNGTRPVGFPPGYLYPSSIRPCAGGYVYVHRHNRFPDLLAALMGQPRLAASDVLAEPLGHADETDAIVDRWLASRDKWRAVEEAQELRVPFTEVLDPGEVVEDRLGQHAARSFFVDVQHPVAGTVRVPGAPLAMPVTPWATRRAPLLGEHNDEVFAGELGLARRSLQRLSAAGVI
jgi:crotonobetainyl-CoA:carnitine CoA-transferase CaiB-like acyl-CoA transferase